MYQDNNGAIITIIMGIATDCGTRGRWIEVLLEAWVDGYWPL